MSSPMPRKRAPQRPSLTPRKQPGPAGGRRAMNRQERTARLLEAAVELFLEQGLDPTTIDDLTRRAGTAKGSFYRYFHSKAHLVEVLFAPVQEGVERLFARADQALTAAQDPKEVRQAYVDLGEALAAALLANAKAVRLYLQECRGPRTEARAPVRALGDVITRGAIQLTSTAHAHGLLRPFPAEVSALTVVGAIERLLFALLDEGIFDNLEGMPAQVTSLVLDGLRAQLE
jgi:AcrR family transcriptional regulator